MGKQNKDQEQRKGADQRQQGAGQNREGQRQQDGGAHDRGQQQRQHGQEPGRQRDEHNR